MLVSEQETNREREREREIHSDKNASKYPTSRVAVGTSRTFQCREIQISPVFKEKRPNFFDQRHHSRQTCGVIPHDTYTWTTKNSHMSHGYQS